MYTSALNLVCGVMDPVLASTIPRSTSSFAIPRRRSPALSPAMPSSSCFLNISTPVTTVLRVSRKPTISTSSPTFTLPRSMRPVTTVPRPEIEKISSIGIRNGLSNSRAGCGTDLSTASISASICFSHFASPFSAPSADRRTTGASSPGNVALQQLANFKLDEIEQLGIIHGVALVQRHHDVRHAYLAGQQHVLAGLRHRTIRRRNHQDRSVHLRRARDHVLDAVGVTGAIHVRIVPVRRLILHARRGNGDAALALFRRVINRIKRAELDLGVVLAQHLGDGRRQRGLAVVNMTNGPYVHVRLAAVKFFLCHVFLASSL